MRWLTERRAVGNIENSESCNSDGLSPEKIMVEMITTYGFPRSAVYMRFFHPDAKVYNGFLGKEIELL